MLLSPRLNIIDAFDNPLFSMLIRGINNKIKENTILINREEITYQVVKYLIQLNHKKIDFSGGE